MSTKRTGSPRASRGATDTSTGPGMDQGQGLSAEEERAIRMRFGVAGSDDLPLPDKSGGDPAVLAKLQEIERRAFAMTGRSPSGGLAEPATKSKIVAALKDKTEAPVAAATKSKTRGR
jgi:hypothetical protein